MKNTLLLFALASMLIFSCRKPDTKNERSSLPTKAETKAQYDYTSFGVYKGVIIGSSGYIVFRINNGDNIAKGYLTIDDKKDTLSTTQTLVAGKPIVDLKFTGRFSSMTLNADSHGYGAEITNIKIEGHPGNVYGIIVHENSTQQVFCYEGKLTGSQTGTINCTRIGMRSGDSTETVNFAIKFSQDTLYVGFGIFYRKELLNINLFNSSSWRVVDFITGAKMDDNNFNGTWDFSEINGKGTFSGKRTY